MNFKSIPVRDRQKAWERFKLRHYRFFQGSGIADDFGRQLFEWAREEEDSVLKKEMPKITCPECGKRFKWWEN